MGNYRRIKSEAGITAAEKQLIKRIQTAATPSGESSIGFQGGMEEREVWWVRGPNFWFASQRFDSRWLNAFGLGKPTDNLSTVVEINPPIRGSDRRMGGAFLTLNGTTYLAHTGKIGGGRKGIGKKQFLAHIGRNTVEVEHSKYIVIGALTADDFLDKLGAFIRAVDAFKKKVVGSNVTTPDTDHSPAPKPNDAPSYWKLSAGINAREWETWLENSYCAIGWGELGDLRSLDPDGFDARASEVLANHPDWKRPRLKQVWRFRHIPIGSRIVVNCGTTRVLAIGTVTGDYHFVEDDGDGRFCHRLPVRWDDVHERVVDRGGWRKTLIQLKRTDFDEIAGAPLVGSDDDDDDDDGAETEAEERLNFDGITAHLGHRGLRFRDETVASYLLALQTKRFVILSGISGTGKTKLAQEIAGVLNSSGVANETTAIRPGVTRVVVRPYMLNHKRLVLPSVVRDQLSELGVRVGGDMDVYYGDPDDEEKTKLSLSQPNLAFCVLFRGEFREWFVDTFEVDDLLDLSVYTDDDDDSVSLVINRVEGDFTELMPNVEGYKVVAVRPDWSDNRGLLGYYNPITQQYSSTPFLKLLLAASAEAKRATGLKRPAEPYFVILDEMNLARVEHYFSDFLSSMESGEPLHLHDDANLAEGLGAGPLIPQELKIPRNLFFTGTVNVDESTYMFSPKVLDRAFVLEFNDVNLAAYGVESDDDDGEDSLRLENFDGRLGLRHNPNIPGPRDWDELRRLENGDFARCLADLNELLEPDNRHFGYRVANEIARFMLLAAEQAGRDTEVLWSAFDVAVLSKIMPKLHGTEQELRVLLEKLLAFAIAGEAAGQETGSKLKVANGLLLPDDDSDAWLPRTGAKCLRMLRQLRLRGFVSFIE